MTGSSRTALQLSVRAALAAALSVGVAEYLQLLYPLNAFITAVLVIDASPALTRQLALPRFAGTLVGAATGATLGMVLPAWPASVGVGILVAMLVSYVLGLEKSMRLAGFISGVILLNYNDAPWLYAVHCLVETTLGIALAVLVSWVPKLLPAATDIRPDPLAK